MLPVIRAKSDSSVQRKAEYKQEPGSLKKLPGSYHHTNTYIVYQTSTILNIDKKAERYLFDSVC